ncbi:ATP-grasp domain-containing protein [Alteromonas sp. CYL-A6]|uniref:ATP-grasp domain-containing protein n=1 Tax=Alteromonas nitratireducens TaxID=3390813 RepID=UPI0034C4ED1C
MLIVILGEHNDPQVRHMHSAIAASGATPVIADTADFGHAWRLSMNPATGDGEIVFNDKTVCLSDIHSVYWHRYRTPRPASVHSNTSLHAPNTASALHSWFLLPDTRWINPLGALQYHQCKPVQLMHAYRLGATIPSTWTGNAPAQANVFCQSSGALIIKPVKGGTTAKRTSAAAVKRHLSEAPVTLQVFVPGTNIRTYVFGSEAVHIQLDSDDVDYRTDQHVTPVTTRVPPRINALSVQICEAFGMYWCAIDWRLTPAGEYVFLEANPCPYFLYVENTTGLDLTGRLLKLLTATASAAAPAKASAPPPAVQRLPALENKAGQVFVVDQ